MALKEHLARSGMGYGYREIGEHDLELLYQDNAPAEDERGRDNEGEAYYFNVDDASYIMRAFARYSTVSSAVLGKMFSEANSEEVVLSLFDDYFAQVKNAFERKPRVAYTRIHGYAQRVKQDPHYWTFKYDGQTDTYYVVTGDEAYKKEVPRDAYIVTESWPSALPQGLGIPEQYKFLPVRELEPLTILDTVYSILRKRGKTKKKVEPGFLAIPTNPHTEALVRAGKKAYFTGTDSTEQRFTSNGMQTVTTREIRVGKTGKERFFLSDDAIALFPKHREHAYKIMRLMANGVITTGSSEGVLTLKYVMQTLGLKDKKYAKNILKNSAKILGGYATEIDERGTDAEPGAYGRRNAFQEVQYVPTKGPVGARVEYLWNEKLSGELLHRSTIEHTHESVFTLTGNNFLVIDEMLRNYRKNIGTVQENRISVDTLLGVTNITTMEELKERDRQDEEQGVKAKKRVHQASQKIIAPFDKILENLVDKGFLLEFQYEYPATARKGQILTEEDIERRRTDYLFFKGLIVNYKINPDILPKEYEAKRENRIKREEAKKLKEAK